MEDGLVITYCKNDIDYEVYLTDVQSSILEDILFILEDEDLEEIKLKIEQQKMK